MSHKREHNFGDLWDVINSEYTHHWKAQEGSKMSEEQNE